uniref:Uncharacterized protein n=1 Tax=Pararge aegeria TaxID=116150 RepID=S4PU86_9NEOP
MICENTGNNEILEIKTFDKLRNAMKNCTLKTENKASTKTWLERSRPSKKKTKVKTPLESEKAGTMPIQESREAESYQIVA